MGVERERVDRYLFGLATHFGSGGAGPLQRSQSRDAIDRRRRERFDRAAEALTAIGAIDEPAVALFRCRLDDEIERGSVPQRVADEALSRRARDLLASRLREVEEGVADPAPGAQSDARHADRVVAFERVLAAYGYCGALSDDERSQWKERLCDADGGRTWWLERDRRESNCTLTDLRAVVRGEATRAGTLRIATAELYADGLVLRWYSHGEILRPPQEAPGARAYPAAVSLTDDVGTEYLHVHTTQGIRSVGGPVAATSTFGTAVPPSATQLAAEIGEQRLTVQLRGEHT